MLNISAKGASVNIESENHSVIPTDLGGCVVADYGAKKY